MKLRINVDLKEEKIMDVGSIANKTTGQITGKSVYKATGKPINVSDKFSEAGKAEKLDADKMKSLKTGKAEKVWGAKRVAKALGGVGIMIGGLMALAVIAHPVSLAIATCALTGGMFLTVSQFAY